MCATTSGKRLTKKTLQSKLCRNLVSMYNPRSPKERFLNGALIRLHHTFPPNAPTPPAPPPPAVLGCAPVSHNPAPKTTDGHVDQDFVPLSPCLRCDVAAALHVENLLKVTRNMTPTGPIQLTVGILTGGDLRKRRCQGHT